MGKENPEKKSGNGCVAGEKKITRAFVWYFCFLLCSDQVKRVLRSA
jgi:hypothetical protein